MRQGFLVMATPSNCELFGSSWKAGGVNKGLGEAPKSCTRKEHESATNSIAERGQGGLRPSSSAPCRVKGQRPLWGLGQRPNCSASDQSQGSRQQRRRQRSVPASNFARPQTRPQAALSPRFREEPRKTGQVSPCRPARLIPIIVITRPARIPPLLRPQCGRRPRSPPQRCRPDGSRHARRRSLRPPRTDPQSPCRRP